MVIPKCSYNAQNKISEIIRKGVIQKDLKLVYENFLSELDSNVGSQDYLMGTAVRYDQ